jgi:uncharacterized protein (DUF697 family)/GTP-binding protein EngB required for normal cell division
VIVAGRSGVGNSTLINAVFQGNMAETGQGRPVTKAVREITKDGIPVSIFDTQGLEMDRYKETVTQLEQLVKERGRDFDPSRHIHVAWLCVSEESRRVEEGESSVAELLARHMPVVVVVTKVRNDRGFRAEVEKLVPDARNVVRVRALAEVDDEGHEYAAKGLSELVDVTMEVVPEGHRNAFAAAQKASLSQKRSRAHIVVGTAATTAAAIGATPIPFSDAMLLVPVQIGMLASISAVFGLRLSEGFVATLVSSAVTALGATLSGQQIVSALCKLVPGAGSAVGGAIAAATAAAITTAFGELYITVLSRMFEASGGEPPSSQAILDAFSAELGKWRGRILGGGS